VDTQKELGKALEVAEKEIRPEVENMIRLSGWPQAVREKITLVVTEETIGVVWPPELNKQIDDLELGTIGKTPTHLLRRINEYIDSVVSKEVSKATTKIMFSGYLPV
jgi:hypothetical protein